MVEMTIKISISFASESCPCRRALVGMLYGKEVHVHGSARDLALLRSVGWTQNLNTSPADGSAV